MAALFDGGGISLAVGRVLVLDWIGPHGPWDDQLLFIFDGGTLSEDRLTKIHVLDPEISEFGLFEPDEAARKLRPDLAQRLRRAQRALFQDQTDYAE